MNIPLFDDTIQPLSTPHTRCLYTSPRPMRGLLCPHTMTMCMDALAPLHLGPKKRRTHHADAPESRPCTPVDDAAQASCSSAWGHVPTSTPSLRALCARSHTASPPPRTDAHDTRRTPTKSGDEHVHALVIRARPRWGRASGVHALAYGVEPPSHTVYRPLEGAHRTDSVAHLSNERTTPPSTTSQTRARAHLARHERRLPWGGEACEAFMEVGGDKCAGERRPQAPKMTGCADRTRSQGAARGRRWHEDTADLQTNHGTLPLIFVRNDVIGETKGVRPGNKPKLGGGTPQEVTLDRECVVDAHPVLAAPRAGSAQDRQEGCAADALARAIPHQHTRSCRDSVNSLECPAPMANRVTPANRAEWRRRDRHGPFGENL